jgi:hypothetical protein
VIRKKMREYYLHYGPDPLYSQGRRESDKRLDRLRRDRVKRQSGLGPFERARLGDSSV